MKFFDYLFAARPLLHLPVWSIYLISLHDYYLFSGKKFGLGDLLLVGILSLTAASAYFLNQIVDIHSDRINDKVGFLQKGLLKSRDLQRAAIGCAVISLAASAAFPLNTTTLVAQAVLGAVLYSMPPFSLMNRPIWGLLVNAYLFGWVVPLVVAPDISLQDVGFPGWGTPLFFSLAVASTHILTTIPDMTGDREAGKRTIAVLFGENASRGISLALLLSSLGVAFWTHHDALSYVALISVITLVFSIFLRHARLTLLATKLPILLTSVLAALYYPAYLLFVVVLIVGTRVYYLKRFGIVYPRLA